MSKVIHNQVTSSILMVRPFYFGWNEQTAVDNAFQRPSDKLSNQEVKQRALLEFDGFVSTLRSHSIRVIVPENVANHETPDAVFPNNWVSFHSDGRAAVFPMFSENRRKERRLDIINDLVNQEGFLLNGLEDYSFYEIEDKFLEGTGSMVLDRENRIAYAALSNRTHKQVLERFCSDFDFAPVIFKAFSEHEGTRIPIYHTNVMMSIGEGFAVICADSIDDKKLRSLVLKSLSQSGKDVILLSEGQNGHFAGNMLQLSNLNGARFLVMSEQAHSSLSPDQIDRLSDHGEIIHSPLSTIESIGGGSARCMIAEIFLPNQP